MKIARSFEKNESLIDRSSLKVASVRDRCASGLVGMLLWYSCQKGCAFFPLLGNDDDDNDDDVVVVFTFENSNQ